MGKSFRRPAVTEQELEKRDRANALCQSIIYKGHMRKKDVAFHIGVDAASLSSWTRGASVVPDYVIDRLVDFEKKVSEDYVEEDSTPRERLKKYIAYRCIPISSFEQAAGLSSGYVASLGNTPYESTLGKISRVFPDLNTEWLKTGKGEMLNGNASLVAAEKEAKMRIVELESEIRRLNAEIARLRSQNARLVEKLLDKE